MSSTLTYNKPHLTIAQQIALLKGRGLQFHDEAAAEGCLRRNGYYRLSAYWYLFRELAPELDTQGQQVMRKNVAVTKRTDTFLSGSTFEDAQALCIFDKQFKLLLMDAIERVEIAVRAEIAYQLGSLDPFAHTNEAFFRAGYKSPDPNDVQGRTKHKQWLDKFEEAVARSRDEFIKHHEEKYLSRTPLPIWIAIELWDFGRLSYFYSGLETQHRVSVATRFSISNRDTFESWLRCINYVRNVIAHHGRLWNLNLADNPKLPTVGTMPEFDVLALLQRVRIYGVCCILSHFSKVTNPGSTWPQELADLVRKFPAMPHASIRDMGFPPDWETHAFWN